MSYRYPYGNTEQMNLDWFLNQWEKFKADWAEAEAGIDGSLDAEIAKVEAAMSELYAARDAAAASASAARQSSLDAAAAQVAAGNSKTAAQAAETSARGSQQAAAESAQEAQASATGAENSALTATQAANTATQQAAGADAAKSAAEAAQQAAEDAQAAAAQSAGQAGQAATAAADHADDAADSATLAQQAAQDMSDSVEQITTNKNDISDLKESLTSVGGINSFAVDSYTPTWNLWDGSWGLVKANPVTGATISYVVCGPIIPVTAGQYYSIGVVDNPLYADLVKVIGIYWYDANNTRISVTAAYPQGGYLKWMQAPTGAVKAVPYYNTNNASVPLSVEQVEAAEYKWFFANRIVNFTNRDSAGQYAINANEWIPSFLVSADFVEHTVTHIVSVGATNSNYTSLRAALDAISEYGYPSETNRFEVQIKEGTYDISSYYTSEEKAASGFIGLTVPDWVTLKGVGSCEKTILQYLLDEASNIICVLNLQNTCSLENLTLYGVKTRYCVHDDKANYVGTPYKRYCKNVHFKGDTMTLGAVYGAGINSNAEWTFEDCIFESLTQTSYQNCFSVHGSGQAVQVGSSSVTFDNCRFIGYGTNNSVILSTLMNNASYFQNYCKFMGCSANGRLILREENASTYGAGIAWWATGFATTFTDEIINNTDGVDYSDHIDII